MRIKLLLPLTLYSLGCHSPASEDDPSIGISVSARSYQLPTLVLDAVTNNPEREDLSRFSTIVIGHDGALIFTSPRETLRFQLLTTDGNLVRIGRGGDGPGEIHDPLAMGLQDSTLVAFDRANMRLSTWDRAGGHLASEPSALSSLTEFVPLGGDRWLIPGPIREQLSVGILSSRTGKVHQVPLGDDSFISSNWPTLRDHASNPPALGAWSDGFVLGDTEDNQAALYGWDGARVAVIAEVIPQNASPLADTTEAPPRWFSRRMRRDAESRMWLMGARGDHTIAAVYQGDSLLGIIEIPCGDMGPRWDLNGEWLALICAPDDHLALDGAVVKKFRIVTN